MHNVLANPKTLNPIYSAPGGAGTKRMSILFKLQAPKLVKLWDRVIQKLWCRFYFANMGRANITFCQIGDEPPPTPKYELKPLSEDEDITLSPVEHVNEKDLTNVLW